MKFKSNVLSVYLYFPSGSTASCWGHTLCCFCCSYGRFLRIILLVTAHRTLLKTRECSGCSTEVLSVFLPLVFLSALRLAWLAGADVSASRPAHIKASSPRSRRGSGRAGATRAAAFLPLSKSSGAGGGLRDTASKPSIAWGSESRG